MTNKETQDSRKEKPIMTQGRPMHTPANPKVTFIVPCYNLAHLLGDCVNSILSQTYDNFEVLIMDDCSPDNTPEVAQSFRDPRVKHVRNPTNLGHLANYNKGIGLAHGTYIWLISADDRLCRAYVLERFVAVLDAHPMVGYVFCSTTALRNGREAETLGPSIHGTRDAIFKGHSFLKRLIGGNKIASPSVMVRKECYDKEVFPLDLPYAGDWYLWCLFALHYDVAYLAEPMVNYRFHDANLTDYLVAQQVNRLKEDDIAVRWYFREKARLAGFDSIVRECDNAIVGDYVACILSREENHRDGLNVAEVEQSVCRHAHRRSERTKICARVYVALGDHYYEQGDFTRTLQYYKSAIKEAPISLYAWVKYIFLQMGVLGKSLRRWSSAAHRSAKRIGT